jgi:predicted Zn-dependent protease
LSASSTETQGLRSPDAGLPPAQDVVEQALAAASRSPAGGDCAVIVEETSEAEVRFANNTTTTNGVRRNRRVTVVRFVEVASGTAAGVARQAGDADVAALVRASERDAASSPAADDAAALIDGNEDPAFGHPPTLTGLEVLGGVLEGLAGAFDRAAASDLLLAGFAEHRVETTYLGTSTGLRRCHGQPTGALHLVGRSSDGRRSSWAGTGSADLAGTGRAALEMLEEKVVRELGWAERRVELPAGRYEVVLPPEAVADLMVALVDAASGREAEEGRTVFSAPGGRTKVGEALADLPFVLCSDPQEPRLKCSPFLATSVSSSDVSVFDNGLPLGRTEWIEGGRLRHLRYHRAGAARSHVEPVAPIDNLVLELPDAAGTTDELVSRTERGLVLTCLWYIRTVDPATLLLTGLTRDGVYLVEDGRVVGAVNNFRFNESPVDVLARTVEAGGTWRTLGREFGEWENRTAMPPLRVADFNMSSVSQAN